MASARVPPLSHTQMMCLHRAGKLAIIVGIGPRAESAWVGNRQGMVKVQEPDYEKRLRNWSKTSKLTLVLPGSGFRRGLRDGAPTICWLDST